jgi:hypothetical protein
MVVVYKNISSRVSNIHTPRHRLTSPHCGTVRDRAGRSVIGSDGVRRRGIPQDYGLPWTTNTLGIVTRGLVATCAALATPGGGRFRSGADAGCFAGRGPPLSGQRTLARAMSYLYYPRNCAPPISCWPWRTSAASGRGDRVYSQGDCWAAAPRPHPPLPSGWTTGKPNPEKGSRPRAVSGDPGKSYGSFATPMW